MPSHQFVIENAKSVYPLCPRKAPASKGAFYFFNHFLILKKPAIQINSRCFTDTRAKPLTNARQRYICSPSHSADTSFLTTITDAVGSSKWHRNLLLLCPFSISRFSILEPQWHLGVLLEFPLQAADELGVTTSAGWQKKDWGRAGGAGRCCRQWLCEKVLRDADGIWEVYYGGGDVFEDSRNA